MKKGITLAVYFDEKLTRNLLNKKQIKEIEKYNLFFDPIAEEFELPFMPIVGDVLEFSVGTDSLTSLFMRVKGITTSEFKVVKRRIWVLDDDQRHDDELAEVDLYVVPIID